MKNKKHGYFGFTLVELIIVITILAILATIAFISFQNYIKDSRDASRSTSIKNIETNLKLFQVSTSKYPDPDEATSIFASGTIIGYQGYIGNTLSNLIKIHQTPLDPLEQTKYLYSTNTLKDKYTILGYFENSNQLSFVDKIYAGSYASKNIKTFGDTLGIIVNQDNSPLTLTGIDIVKSQNPYKGYIGNLVLNGTGEILRNIAINYDNKVSYSKSCKEIQDNGSSVGDGKYKINPYLTGTIDVYCDMTTEGGGWTRVNYNLVNEISGTGLTLGINFGENDILNGLNNYRGCPITGTYNFKINGIKIENISSLRFELERTNTILQCSKLSSDIVNTTSLGTTQKVGYIDDTNIFQSWGNTCQWYSHDTNSKWDTGHGEKLNNSAIKKWRWIYNYTGTSDIYYTTGCSGPNDNGYFSAQVYIK